MKNAPVPPARSHDALHSHKPVETCPYCGGRQVARKGTRRNKHGTVQLFRCVPCNRKFTPLVSKHKSFPLRVIMDALTLYNRLYTLEDAAAAVSRKYGLAVSRQNVSNWLKSYAEHLTVRRLRPAMAAAYEPHRLLLECQLLHGQVYAFKFHRAKMDLILDSLRPAQQKQFAALRDYLAAVPRKCPHDVFRREQPRASAHKAKFSLDAVPITPRDNAAIRNARFALQAVSANKLRHETLQHFMLMNDSVTVAVEVPIVLRPDDLAAFKLAGYQVPLALKRGEALTGHIDILQIRYGLIHILDYKPNAKKVKPIEQLTLYALALSRLTGIRLNDFKCAWFDDEHYFEFFPRAVVSKPALLGRPQA